MEIEVSRGGFRLSPSQAPKRPATGGDGPDVALIEELYGPQIERRNAA